jgi:hypothetical protein
MLTGTLSKRLANLEMRSATAQGNFEVVMIVVDRHSDDEIDAFLVSEGIVKSGSLSLIIIRPKSPAGQDPGPQSPIRRVP